jgi:hypothetical protein
MKSKTMTKHSFTLTLCLLLAFALSMPALAQTTTSAAGRIRSTFTEQHQFPIGDAENHILSLAKSVGTDSSATPGGFMDGAASVNYSVGDLVNGNGHQFGYVVFTKGADTVYVKWEHDLTTTMSADGKPQMTFKGTFTYTGGTGQYKGIQGNGTFTGAFTSPTEWMADWQGDYTIAKAMPMK